LIFETEISLVTATELFLKLPNITEARSDPYIVTFSTLLVVRRCFQCHHS